MIDRVRKRFKRRMPLGVGASFRARYEAVERGRQQMLERLNRLPDQGRSHPGYRRTLTLLNERFRKANIAQRVAILQSAEWLIDVLETLITIT